MGRILEGKWDCTSCDATGIRGSVEICPGCGAPQPEDVEFYLPDGSEYVSDTKLIREARSGEDWFCSSCDAGNDNLHDICTQCGAPKPHQDEIIPYSERIKRKVPDKIRKLPNEVFNTSGTGISRIITGLVLFLVIAAVAALSIGIYHLFQTETVNATITGKQWTRSIEIGEYIPQTKEGWEIPLGGRYITERREIRDHRTIYEKRTRPINVQVPDGFEEYPCGTRDLGNGFFEEITCKRQLYRDEWREEEYSVAVGEEPIYDTKYVYEIDVWVTLRNVSASGADNVPYWPTPDLRRNEEAGVRSENYVINFNSDDNKSYKKEVSIETFLKYHVHESVKIQVNRFGMVRKISR